LFVTNFILIFIYLNLLQNTTYNSALQYSNYGTRISQLPASTPATFEVWALKQSRSLVTPERVLLSEDNEHLIFWCWFESLNSQIRSILLLFTSLLNFSQDQRCKVTKVALLKAE